MRTCTNRSPGYFHFVSVFTALFHRRTLTTISESHAALVVLQGAVRLPLAPVPRRPQQFRRAPAALPVQDVRQGEGEVQAVGDHGGDGVGLPEHVSVRFAEQSLRAVGSGVPVNLTTKLPKRHEVHLLEKNT